MRAALALLALAVGAASQRTRASFDADWRFLLGDPRLPPPCNASSFFPLPSTQCLGQSHVPGAASAPACQDACCAAGSLCQVWTFAQGAGCWVGDSCSDFLNDTHWQGGSKAATPGPPPNPVCAPTDPCWPAYDSSSWRRLAVPHDYGVEGAFSPDCDPNKGALPKNASWYVKHFAVDAGAEGSQVYLTFDGVFRSADVFLNGAFVLHHEEGYTSFHAWLHNASAPLLYGGADNVLAVFVDARAPELWSYEGMGIYRHVWLETAPQLSVVPWGFYVPAYVNGSVLSPGGAAAPQDATGALLTPTLDLANAGAQTANGTVVFSLADAGGATVCASAPLAYSLRAGGWARLSAPLACGSPAAPVHLWNTAPGGAYLYTAHAAVLGSGGSVVDAVAARVGLRSALFSPTEGFVLNGFKVPLLGFSNHIGFGGVGGALPDRVQEYLLVMLRATGGNAYRTAHNPVAPELLDYCDQYGVIVWEENRFVELGVLPQPAPRRGGAASVQAGGGSGGGSGGSSAPQRLRASPSDIPAAVPRLLQDAQDMVLRDRNHPSIVIWSLCNELGCTSDSPTGGDIADQFKQALYAADTSRPITGNTVQRPYLSGRLVDEFAIAMDVQSFSHQFENVPAYHAVTPWKAVGLGESGSCESDRGEYAPRSNRSAGTMGFSGVVECVLENLEALTIPYSFGSFSWTLQDYLGETTLGFPDVSSHYGLFDIAGFPKDTIGAYTAWWRDPAGGCAAISLAPTDWTAPVAPGENLTVYAFTCAPTAELFVNGASQGAVAVPPQGAAQWPNTAFAPGNLTAVAYGAGGQVLARASVLTAGAPAALRLWVEGGYLPPRNASVIAAAGGDVALLGVQVVDAAGLPVPVGAANVSFTVAGPGAVVGVHNGDPADRSPTRAAWRLTFHGKARAILASTGAQGELTVTASAPGLAPASVQLLAQ